MNTTILTYVDSDEFVNVWYNHVIGHKRYQRSVVFGLNDYVGVIINDEMKIYDKQTLQYRHSIYHNGHMRHADVSIGNRFSCKDLDDAYRLYVVDSTKTIAYDILGLEVPKMCILAYIGFGIYQLVRQDDLNDEYYLAELTKIIFPNGDIAYAFTNITRTKHDISDILDVYITHTSNCEIVVRVKDNTLLLYKSTNCKELAVDSKEKLLEFATFANAIQLDKNIPIEEYKILEPLLTPCATFPNAKELISVGASHFGDRETVLINIIDSDKQYGTPKIIDDVDMCSLSVRDLTIQVDAETFTIINGIVDIRDYIIALTNNICVTGNDSHYFNIFTCRDNGTLTSRKYYRGEYMYYIVTNPNKISFIMSDGDFTTLEINDV
jgi:hypothetical protein